MKAGKKGEAESHLLNWILTLIVIIIMLFLAVKGKDILGSISEFIRRIRR